MKKLATRDEVEQYIARKMNEDQDTKRFERSQVVLKKFGLLPRDFELKGFLVSLLRDQVAGFYDVKTKTVYLLDWVDPELQKPVMAHELTHALQDQNFDLEKMEKETKRDEAEKQGDINRVIALDEDSTAESAMIEGQGMIAFADYSLRQYGRSAQDSAEAIDAMIDGMGTNDESGKMAQAPMLLRESLIFPYRDGMRFVEAVLLKKGKQGAFAGMFERPPTTSFEIMTPEAYLREKPVPQMRLPESPGSWAAATNPTISGPWANSMSSCCSSNLPIPPTCATSPPDGTGAPIMPPCARENLRAVPHRSHSCTSPTGATRKRRRISPTSTPTVWRKNTRPCSLRNAPPVKAEKSAGTAEEGFAEIDQRGSRVIVTEGFDPPVALRLRDAVLSGAGQELSVHSRELSIRAVPSWIRVLLADAVPLP